MSLITSYAQNYEDVLLWRALGEIERGFYVDLGASDPVSDSVTNLFYDRGWHGINVEPADAPFERLTEQRPRDINLKCLIAAEPGTKTFFVVGDGVGLSTTTPEFAQQHQAAGWQIREQVVPTRTLASICEEHAPHPIHFLKIDIEGSEAAALQGADFQRFRPWIVLIEATRPNSRVPSHQEWEPGLLRAGYMLVYFDGLNRFYVATERAEHLRRHFTLPPNVFDQFERANERHLRERVQKLEQRLADAGL